MLYLLWIIGDPKNTSVSAKQAIREIYKDGIKYAEFELLDERKRQCVMELSKESIQSLKARKEAICAYRLIIFLQDIQVSKYFY